MDKDIYIGQDGKGTGKILWPAAELLSEFIAQPSSNGVFTEAIAPDMYPSGSWSWEQKNVLELGSGLGLLTTTLLLLGSTVLATDGEITVVNQLNINVAENKDLVLNARHVMPFRGVVYRWGGMSLGCLRV